MRGDSTHFFHRLRLPILLFFAALALWGAYAVPEPAPVTLAAAAVGGFLAAYARLRHIGLALAASVAPLPGIFWFGQAPYALSIAFAILMAADYSDALLKEQNPYTALARALPPLVGALLFACVWSLHVPVQLPGLLAAAAATALCLPVLALGVGFGETRTRKQQGRCYERQRVQHEHGIASQPDRLEGFFLAGQYAEPVHGDEHRSLLIKEPTGPAPARCYFGPVRSGREARKAAPSVAL